MSEENKLTPITEERVRKMVKMHGVMLTEISKLLKKVDDKYGATIDDGNMSVVANCPL
jgi:hypothetical protein